MVELGIRAEALLNSKTFRLVIDHIASLYVSNILTSALEEREKREDQYHMHRALNDVVSQLSGFVITRDTILKGREQQEDE